MTSVCFRRLVFRNPAHQGLAYLHIALARIGKPGAQILQEIIVDRARPGNAQFGVWRLAGVLGICQQLLIKLFTGAQTDEFDAYLAFGIP